MSAEFSPTTSTRESIIECGHKFNFQGNPSTATYTVTPYPPTLQYSIPNEPWIPIPHSIPTLQTCPSPSGTPPSHTDSFSINNRVSLSRPQVNGAWSLPNVVCDFYIAMDVICSTSSIFNLVAISIDRYVPNPGRVFAELYYVSMSLIPIIS